MKNNPKYILIHCTDCSYRDIADQFVACNGWHKDRGFPLSSKGLYIGYTRLITGGYNYECRLETDEGAHCNQEFDGVKIYTPGSGKALSMNFQSLAACVGFNGDIELIPQKEYALLQKQVWDWQDRYNITNDKVFFHRHFATNKTCPGKLITDQWLKDLLVRPLPVPTTPQPSQCLEEKVVIESQKVQISNLQKLLQLIINFFNLK